MEKFKIKKIKNLRNLKNVYSFISYTFFNDGMKDGEGLLPFHELYEVMLDNLAYHKEYQFYGVVDKEIVSTVISSELPYDKECLMVQIFFVQELLRGNGIAGIMLSEIEKFAINNHFKRIRIVYNDVSESFFVKHKYEIYLELAIPETLEIEDIIRQNNISLQCHSKHSFNKTKFLEYLMPEADWRMKNTISKHSPLVKANFVLEKKLDMN